MPKLLKRRKVRPTKRKYRVTKKRVKKLRRAKRKRVWYKKWKGKKSIYHFNKTQGLKFSLWCNLQEFLTLAYDSFMQPVLAAASDYDSDHPVYFKTCPISDSFSDQSSNLLAEILTVFSTEDITPKENGTIATKKLLWKAFNPILSQHTCGPLFNNMINLYNQVKYCGVKVAWYPNVKYVPTRTVDEFKQTNRGTSGNSYNTFEVYQGNGSQPLWLDLQGQYGFHVDTPKGIHKLDPALEPYNAPYGGYGIPPCLRLWVNFNKQGYEQRDILTEKFAGVTVTGVDESKLIKGSRYATARVFDDYNHPTFQGNIRSYPLNKRFKFYVRPMIVDTMNEAPTNNCVLRNYEGVSSNYQKNLLRVNADSDVLVTSLKKFPYVQINNLFPFYQNFTDGPKTSGAKDINDWVVTNCVSKYFVDPILFSWCLTDDSLTRGNVSLPFSIEKKPDKFPTGTLNTATIESYDYLQNLGKFKLTFYTKWRGSNAFQFLVPTNQSIRNANYQDERPNMEEEPI